jgi:two-component system, NarL family, response regulator DevR
MVEQPKGGPFVIHAETLTAVVLDRHPLWHEAVEHVLQRLEVRVVAKTTSPALALHAIEKQRPDLLVTGVTMEDSDLDGIECVREARERMPELSAIVLSMRCEPRIVDAAIDAGAFAHLPKSAHPDELAETVMDALAISADGALASETSERSSRLTRRELEILQLLAQGHSNAQLAKLLWVTEQTIKFHLSNIYRKLNVSNRTEAAHWAQVRGLLETAPDPVGTGS